MRKIEAIAREPHPGKIVAVTIQLGMPLAQLLLARIAGVRIGGFPPEQPRNIIEYASKDDGGELSCRL